MHLPYKHRTSTQPFEEATHDDLIFPIRVVNVLSLILFLGISPAMGERTNYALLG